MVARAGSFDVFFSRRGTPSAEDTVPTDVEEFFAYGRSSDRRDARARYRYIGVERDEETGLCMTGPRTYDPVVGRFHQRDPADRSTSPLYAYCRGNPLVWRDPTGYSEGKGFLGGIFKKKDSSAPAQPEGVPLSPEQSSALAADLSTVSGLIETPAIQSMLEPQDVAHLEGALLYSEQHLADVRVEDLPNAKGMSDASGIKMDPEALAAPNHGTPTIVHEGLHQARKDYLDTTTGLTEGRVAFNKIGEEYSDGRITYITDRILAYSRGELDDGALRDALSAESIHQAAWETLGPYTARLERLAVGTLNMSQSDARAFVRTIEAEARAAFKEQRAMNPALLRGL